MQSNGACTDVIKLKYLGCLVKFNQCAPMFDMFDMFDVSAADGFV